MSKQVSENRNDVLPLRLDEEIRNDEKESRGNVSEELLERSRCDLYSRTRDPEYDLVYHIDDTDIGFQEVLEEIEGINSCVLEKEYDREGNKSKRYIRDQDIDLREYMEWFFLPDEVFDVRKVDMMADDDKLVWNDVYWVAGYSDFECDTFEFGPFDSFEGPPLKYAMVSINNEGSDSLFEYSTIESSKYHPQVKMDQYTEDGTFPQRVLEEGPETI